MNALRLVFALIILSCGLTAANPAYTVGDFFKDYSFDEIKLSPDGTKVAALSRWKDHLNLYVIDLKTKKPLQLTGLTNMDVSHVRWVGNDRLIFTGMEDGYLGGGLFAIDANGKHSRALGKSVKQQASSGKLVARLTYYLAPYARSEDEILVVSNERREFQPDVYRMNVNTGVKQIVARNPGKVASWFADHEGVVRMGFGEDGRHRFVLYRPNSQTEWKEVYRGDFMKGDLQPLAFHQNGRHVFMRSTLSSDTGAVVLFDPAEGKVVKEIYSDPIYDVDDVILDPDTHELLGIYIVRERPEIVWLNEHVKKLQAMIDAELPGSLNQIYSISQDTVWMVFLAHSDRDPGTFYLFNREKLTLEKLVLRAEWLDPRKMVEMKPISYTARDGLVIHGYLAVPNDRPADRAAELLLVVRGLHLLAIDDRRQRRRGVPVARPRHHEGRAAELVGAALGDHAGHAGRMSTELGGELVGDELHLFHRLDGEAARPELRRALQRQPLGVIVGAVDVSTEVPHLAAADVDGVRSGAGGDDVRVERQQAKVVALLDRQRLEREAIDRARDLGRPRLDDRVFTGDGDRFAHARQLEGEIEDGVLTRIEPQVLAHLAGEPRDLHLHPVHAFRRQGAHDEPAAGIRRHDARQAGRDVLNGDGGACQYGLLRVVDDPFDGKGRVLGQGRSRDRDQEEEEQ